MKKNIFKNLLFMASIFIPSILPLSCANAPYNKGTIIDLGEYFANTEYEYVENIKQGNVANGGLALPLAQLNAYYSSKIYWDIFDQYKNDVNTFNSSKSLISSPVKKRNSDEKFMWFALYQDPYQGEMLLEKYYPINHYWWDYDQAFREITGYLPYYTGNNDQELFQWMDKYPTAVYTYIDDEPKFNFLSYDSVNNKLYSFIATPSETEIILVDEYTNLEEGENIINWPWMHYQK